MSEAALRTAAVAVNRDYVRPEHDSFAMAMRWRFCQPVSGGSGGQVELVRERIDADSIGACLSRSWERDGAVCVFDGIGPARQHTRPRDPAPGLRSLQEEMALKQRWSCCGRKLSSI